MYFFNFRISADKLDFESIDKELNLENIVRCKNGDVVKTFGKTKEIREDVWQSVFEEKDLEQFQNSMEAFVESLKEKRSFVRHSTERYNVTAWITIYPENLQTNIH
ncbi:MAG: hypothetical protein LUG52_04785, partial [Clostridia bacterium]|nr:hypothetical protein [Clostridia bacterium]